ncbi:hypothetical protein ACQP1K_18920 [Sphaerimonospora sp. CA-214678]|uniref:hypothetical protein n=1 Tax=Sphaerimonospora sp. CA-214678 TaxID=3240029 RepID=UPI003D93EA25
MTGIGWYEVGFRVAADVVGVPPAFPSGPVVSGLVYGVFFVMVLIGFRGRLRRSRVMAANVEAVAA